MNQETGLTTNQVEQLKQKYGENILLSREEFSGLKILLLQFANSFIYILGAVFLISLFLRDFFDAGLCAAVIVVNVLMGFYQEYSAHKTLEALKKFLKPQTTVIRDGKRKIIEIKELVPKDIVLFSSGDRIPADGRLLEGINLLVNEAILTGEEEAIQKKISPNCDLLFMGTTVLAGRGKMEVQSIGPKTKIGEIGESLSKIEKIKTPLQLKLASLVKYLAWLVIIICALIFLTGLLYQEDIWEIFKMSIVLAIAALPEGLPIAITVILALGMRRILKRQGLVRKLIAIETLGSTSVICTDKTGTLTEGKMQVIKVETKDKEKINLVMVLVNEQKTNLELALLEYAKNQNFDIEETIEKYPKIGEEPFNSANKYALSINKIGDKETSLIIGAPEIILSFSRITEKEKLENMDKINNWANEGFRVLGAAFKIGNDLLEKKNFQWLGLIGIRDPLREEAKIAVRGAKDAGIQVKIVTGDYRLTGENVARNLGLDVSPNNVLEGKEIDQISEEDLKEKIEKINLFARVNPMHKLRIVKALQANGEIVAMTGDGVNDAPALKQANIGIAVGSATDVAKETSDLVLLDNNFKTIMAACEEGRMIFTNIKKVVGYILSNAFAEIILIFGAMIFGFSTPLSVVQILWIHLICDGPPDIILGFEPKEKDLMKENPKKLSHENILSREMKFLILAISSTIGLLSLYAFSRFNKVDIDLARTIAFATVGSASLIYIFAFKNLKRLVFQTENFWQNYYLFFAVFYGFILMFAAIYLPFLNRILKTVPLHIEHWLIVLGTGFAAILIVEITKIVSGSGKKI